MGDVMTIARDVEDDSTVFVYEVAAIPGDVRGVGKVVEH
jgi:hypothetical protein